MSLDQYERRMRRRGDGDQLGLRPGNERLVPLSGDPRDFAVPDPLRGVAWPARPAREPKPPVPVDEEDVEHLVAAEFGAEPVDVAREAQKQSLTPFVRTVLVEEVSAVAVLVPGRKGRTANYIKRAPVPLEESAQLLAVAPRVELAAQERGDELVFRDSMQEPRSRNIVRQGPAGGDLP
jgi:hypothetical protein